jgi:hypothetical protein
MNVAHALGIFLAFYKSRESREGEIVKVPFPGPVASFNAQYAEVGQRTLARAHLFSSGLALQSTTKVVENGAIYNVSDTASGDGTSWAEKWAPLCAFFGLEGVDPEEKGKGDLRVGQYMRAHQNEWESWEKEHQLVPGVVKGASWEFLELILEIVVFDRRYDLTKLAKEGFQEKQDVVEAYTEVFLSMRSAGMIP